MEVGDRVHHYQYGAGVVRRVSADLMVVRFSNSGSEELVYAKNLTSAETKEDAARRRKMEARRKADQATLSFYKPRILKLLAAGEFDKADAEHSAHCQKLWPIDLYQAEKKNAQAEMEKRRRASLKQRVEAYLCNQHYVAADALFEEQCRSWWPVEEYRDVRDRHQVTSEFVNRYAEASLNELDQFVARGGLSADDLAALKSEKVAIRLARLGISFDEDQLRVCARPERRLLVQARAGSGKTRTLAAVAALAIADGQLAPDQVLTLAFNKKAAEQISERVQAVAGINDYRNARTFHSLGWQLADHAGRQLVFDDGNLSPSRRKQSLFVERVIHAILNPAFREKLYEFFRREIEQVERIGSTLAGEEYLSFRRAMTDFSLGGDSVRSNGEKFIADFLFEHDISYVYERVYSWESKDRLQGSPYRPDFCLTVGGKDFILEHWAIDPDDAMAELPHEWQTRTQEYRIQIADKRKFWAERRIPLLETHAGMLGAGRTIFEEKLQVLLTGQGIQCQKLDQQVLVDRVAQSPRAISRMSDLFLGFISRSKKRGWGVEQVANAIALAPDVEPRNRVFHELAVRAYAEYERLLVSESSMDFDDLLISATEQVRKLGTSAAIRLDRQESIRLIDLKWILIDEFQDVSELYYRLVKAILEVNPEVRVIAVGDDWQAINGFAGAQLTFFEQFCEHFDGAGRASIPTNYRSGSAIVGAGNSVMSGRGQAAISSKSWPGEVECWVLDKVWVGNDGKDRLYLDAVRPPLGQPVKASHYQAAKAIKACANFIIDSVFVHDGQRYVRNILLLSRTSNAYGMELETFGKALRWVLEQHSELQDLANAFELDVLTAHRSKGKEADTVIVLEATASQFPKVHADNQLFGPFGVTIADTLAEERRLFYVAITRAEHRLLLLTETGQESPYLLELGLASGRSNLNVIVESKKPSAVPMGQVARTIKCRLEQIDRSVLIRHNITPAAVPVFERIAEVCSDLPEVPYFLGSLCAELAWPKAQPPIAILTGHHRKMADEWRANGWRVYQA